ncbi:hypothetical protein GS416_09975 [Rhodococcus hoagii]|nr:hypothetical protein [Prescottella equi]
MDDVVEHESPDFGMCRSTTCAERRRFSRRFPGAQIEQRPLPLADPGRSIVGGVEDGVGIGIPRLRCSGSSSTLSASGIGSSERSLTTSSELGSGVRPSRRAPLMLTTPHRFSGCAKWRPPAATAAVKLPSAVSR